MTELAIAGRNGGTPGGFKLISKSGAFYRGTRGHPRAQGGQGVPPGTQASGPARKNRAPIAFRDRLHHPNMARGGRLGPPIARRRHDISPPNLLEIAPRWLGWVRVSTLSLPGAGMGLKEAFLADWCPHATLGADA
jgi:hypothetical protein